MFSTEIDTKSDPMTAAYMMYIYHDENYEKYESCYLTATLDSNMAPSSGLTVEENDMYSYNCFSLKDGEMINYAAPVDETTSGAVSINGTMFDLYGWDDVAEGYYDEEGEGWEDEWAYDYDDWEYDYDYGM